MHFVHASATLACAAQMAKKLAASTYFPHHSDLGNLFITARKTTAKHLSKFGHYMTCGHMVASLMKSFPAQMSTTAVFSHTAVLHGHLCVSFMTGYTRSSRSM